MKHLIYKMLRTLILEEGRVEDIYKQYYSKVPFEEFQQILAADPTSLLDGQGGVKKMGNYSKWMLDLYQQNNLKLEDLVKMKNNLSIFAKNFRNLPIEQRDIRNVKSLPDLYKLVQPFDGNKTNGELEREVKSGGSEKLYEDSQWTVIWIKTEQAANYYGKGTQWCTCADNGNLFNHYNKQGPLYVNINKTTGDKYQFHFETRQYMDATDKPIKPQDILSPAVLAFYDKLIRGSEGRVITLVANKVDNNNPIKFELKLNNEGKVVEAKTYFLNVFTQCMANRDEYLEWFFTDFMLINLSQKIIRKIDDLRGESLMRNIFSYTGPVKCFKADMINYIRVQHNEATDHIKRNYYSVMVPLYFHDAINTYYSGKSNATLEMCAALRETVCDQIGIVAPSDGNYEDFCKVTKPEIWERFQPWINETGVWNSQLEFENLSLNKIFPLMSYEVLGNAIKSVQ